MSISLVIYVLFYFLFATSFIILVNKDGQKTYVKGVCDLSLEEQAMAHNDMYRNFSEVWTCGI